MAMMRLKKRLKPTNLMAYRLLGPHAHADFQSSLFHVGNWDKSKHNGTGDNKSSGQVEYHKALAETSNTICMNSADCGVPLGECKS
jgi:hypothetical protein